jgi:hypothetical protein
MISIEEIHSQNAWPPQGYPLINRRGLVLQSSHFGQTKSLSTQQVVYSVRRSFPNIRPNNLLYQIRILYAAGGSDLKFIDPISQHPTQRYMQPDLVFIEASLVSPHVHKLVASDEVQIKSF